MSERMIELQRAKLLSAGKGSGNSGQATQNGSPTMRSASAMGSTAHARQTPQEAAASYVQSEDRKMRRFLQRLEHRDDSRSGSISGPTVPTALSRRILQREGVGYLDDSVGAIASAAADRFLATVLSQSIACRDQRLMGAELAKETARHRKRHLEHYQADADDRKRRKEDNEQRREKAHLAAIEAAEALKKRGAASAAGGSSKQTAAGGSKSKKKRPASSAATALNGNKQKIQEDDEASYDSIDEEEEYYQQYYGDNVSDEEEEDDEEEDDMLILRDLSRPLEAWGFHVTGKEGMDPTAPNEEDEEEFLDDDDEDDDDDILVQNASEQTELTGDQAASSADTPSGKGGDGKAQDGKSKTSRQKSSSPTPTAQNATKMATT